LSKPRFGVVFLLRSRHLAIRRNSRTSRHSSVEFQNVNQAEEAIMVRKQFATGSLAIALLAALGLSACKPSNDPPPDIIKTQRDALNKAKAVKDVVAQSAQAQQKAADEQTKTEDAASDAANK
jgi:hypothetical protein